MRANSTVNFSNRRLKKVLAMSLGACLFLSTFGATPMEAATKEKADQYGKDFLAMMVKESPMSDGAEFINKMKGAADSYQTYYFEYKMTAFKKGTVVEEGKFWFKKPRLLRLEEVGSYKKGCIAILMKSGKVKARGGGALSMFQVDLPSNSGMLKSANGYPMIDSDLSSLAEALKQFLAEGKTSKVTDNPVQISTQPDKVYILDVFQEPSHQIYKRVAVDTKSTLPVEWWDYEGGKLVSHSIWKTFKGNIAIADNLFEETARK